MPCGRANYPKGQNSGYKNFQHRNGIGRFFILMFDRGYGGGAETST